VYEWSADLPPEARLRALSVLPAGEGGATVKADPGSGEGSAAERAISADGSRVFWTENTGGGLGGGLYVRDTSRGETARLDEVQGGFGTGEAKPRFLGADADGAVAYFTDTQNLTADANESGADLYRCAVVVEGGELACELTDLTARTVNPADPFESADVQGLPAGISADGESLYFVAEGVLDARANREGGSAAPGQPNLYLWRDRRSASSPRSPKRTGATGACGSPPDPGAPSPST